MNTSAPDDSAGTTASVKDMLGGALLAAGGVAVVIAAQGYGVGTLTEMGAGYFPTLIGAVVLGIGVLMLAQAAWRFARTHRAPKAFSAKDFLVGAKPVSEWLERIGRLRGMLCILAGLAAFIVAGAYGGLLPASFAVVFISALGDRNNTLLSALLLALAMTAICVVVFWWALQLQMPLFHFFG